MEVDMSKEKLNINKLVGTKNDMVFVEGDMIIPDIKPDIINVIDTSGNICIYKKEVLDGKIRIDGNINLYILYLADSETDLTRGLNTNLDFTKIIDIDNCSSNMELDEKVDIKTIECKIINGRKIGIKVGMSIEAKIYSNEEIEILNGINNIENIQTLVDSIPINNIVGVGASKTYAKDTIVIDNTENLAEILKVKFEILNQDMKTSYNKVLLKADANIKIMYLTDDGVIKSVENTIPVMGFIDITGISEEDICEVKFDLKNIIVKPNSVEEHSIYIEAEIELRCKAYKQKEINIIQDMYSPTCDVQFTQKNIETLANKTCRKSVCNIKEKINIPQIGNNKIYDVEVTPLINNINVLNGRILYEGELKLKFLIQSNNENTIETRNYNIPFDFTLEFEEINGNKNIENTIRIINQNFVVLPEGTIDSMIDLEFNVNMSDNISVNIIDKVEVLENRDEKIYSMIIYFTRTGDTLWKIAKRFRTTIEDITRINNIQDINKLDVGIPLFIPKYKMPNTRISA